MSAQLQRQIDGWGGRIICHLPHKHLMAIMGIALADPQPFREDNDAFSLSIGVLAYAFSVAMAATSFDRSVMWLGARSWKILHTVGAYYIWLTFLIVVVPTQPRVFQIQRPDRLGCCDPTDPNTGAYTDRKIRSVVDVSAR
jgi:hypothetical protein